MTSSTSTRPALALQCGASCVTLQQCGATLEIHWGSIPARVRTKSCDVSTISPATTHCGWLELGLGAERSGLGAGFFDGSPRSKSAEPGKTLSNRFPPAL